MDFLQQATAETSELVERLVAAMAAEVEAATGRIQAAADAALVKVRIEAEQLKAALDKARANERTLQAKFEKACTDEKTHQLAFEKARADEKTLGAELQKEQERSAALQAQLKQAVAAHAVADAERRKVQTAAEQTTGRKTVALEKELDEAGRLVAAANTERDAIAQEMQRAEASWLEQSRDVRDQVTKITSGSLDHLRAAFYRMESTKTVAEALTVLIDSLATEFSRVALFHVNGNRLEGRHQTGFDPSSDISKVAVPLTKGSALAEAVRSGQVQGLTSSELTDSSRKLFGGTPTFVLVLPVAIGGEIQAVLYADNSDQPQPQFVTPRRGVSFAEILLWHAVPLLARLSREETILAELHAYGSQLIADLESVYSGDLAAGHKGEKLQRRLHSNLEYARSMYAQRVESRGAMGAALFDEQLAAVISQHARAPFGRDLASVVGAPAGADRGKLSAEAS